LQKHSSNSNTNIQIFANKMSAPTDGATSSKKRKNVKEGGVPSSKRRAVAEIQSEGEMAKIQELEDQISESRKYYNNIVTLISMLNADGNEGKPNLAVAVSLCRVFSRLIAVGKLTETSRAAENEKIIVAWLKERCREYQRALVSILREADPSSQVCHPGFSSTQLAVF
jgi:U3 small nucleolar RNA-associated protein 19